MELERNHCHCLILYIGMIKWNVITAFFFLLILSTGFIQITWQASKTISVLENELPLEMIDLNSLSTNSPNFKPITLKLRTSAIPSNIPVDCAEMCYSGNAFPSTLWIKDPLRISTNAVTPWLSFSMRLFGRSWWVSVDDLTCRCSWKQRRISAQWVTFKVQCLTCLILLENLLRPPGHFLSLWIVTSITLSILNATKCILGRHLDREVSSNKLCICLQVFLF